MGVWCAYGDYGVAGLEAVYPRMCALSLMDTEMSIREMTRTEVKV